MNGTEDEPLVAQHPEIPAGLALQGFEGVRAYSSRPGSTAALIEQLMGAERREDQVWELRGGAAAAGSPSIPRRPSRDARAPGPSTTSREARPTPSRAPGSSG